MDGHANTAFYLHKCKAFKIFLSLRDTYLVKSLKPLWEQNSPEIRKSRGGPSTKSPKYWALWSTFLANIGVRLTGLLILYALICIKYYTLIDPHPPPEPHYGQPKQFPACENLFALFLKFSSLSKRSRVLS